MSDIRINGVKLDWIAQRILEILADKLEEEATTKELRQEIPGADNDDIRYRVDRLEEAGCVGTHHQEDGRNNSPKVVFLDPHGPSPFRDYDIDGTPPKESVEARVGAIEDEIDELRAEISDLYEAMDQLKEAFAEQDVRLKAQQEIRDRLAEIEEKHPEEALESMESVLGSVDDLEQRVEQLETFRIAFDRAVDGGGDQSDGTPAENDDGEDQQSEKNQDGTYGKVD